MVTHDREMVDKMRRRVIALEDGRLARDERRGGYESEVVALKLIVSESLRSLGANLSTTFAATVTVLIGMFLLGLFIAFGTWVVSWTNHVKRELVVHVYFTTTRREGSGVAQMNAVARALQASPLVKKSTSSRRKKRSSR